MATKISELPVGSITGAHRIPSIPTVGNTETITVDDIIALANAGFTLADLITMLASDVSGCLAALNAGVQSGAVWNTGTSTQDGVVSPAKIAGAVAAQMAGYLSIGSGGQSWTSVTRSYGTVYRNLTGRPIVFLYTTGNNYAGVTNHYIGISWDASAWYDLCVTDTNTGNNTKVLSAIIPPGIYYRPGKSVGGSTLGINAAWELR